MIVCIGSIFLDHVSKVDKLPKKPIKILSKKIERRLGGSAAVASFTAKKLGCKSEFIGRFGNDDASKFLISEFKNNSINTKNSIFIKNAQTSQSYVIEDKNGERLLAAYNDIKLLNYTKKPDLNFNKNQVYSIDSRWVELSEFISKKTQKKKIFCVADLDNFKLSKKIKSIVKNASHPIFSEEGIKEYKKKGNIQKKLLDIYKETNKFVAVTLGSNGVLWIEDGNLYHCKPPKVKVVETNCAGDVFHGAFASALNQKKNITQSIIFATSTATLKCMKSGGVYSIPNLNSVSRFSKKIKVIKIL